MKFAEMAITSRGRCKKLIERQTYTAMPAFTGRNVPVTEIAKCYAQGRAVCKSWLTAGRIQVWLCNQAGRIK